MTFDIWDQVSVYVRKFFIGTMGSWSYAQKSNFKCHDIWETLSTFNTCFYTHKNTHLHARKQDRKRPFKSEVRAV